jgi:hypothetical protein
MANDSTVLPIEVACERSGLSEAELLGHWHVQTFKRILPEREPEIAVVVPNYLVTTPARVNPL